MEDYNACKMYIIFDDNWDCYIGHTIQTLEKRLGVHLSTGKTVSTMINPEIFPLEDYPCNNLLEARMREQCWIDTFPKAINKKRAYISEEMKKEKRKILYLNNKESLVKIESVRLYQLNNKENIKKQQKLYYLKNKESFAKRQKLHKLNNKEAEKERNRLYRLKNKQKNRFKYQIKKVLLKDKIDIIFTPG